MQHIRKHTFLTMTQEDRGVVCPHLPPLIFSPTVIHDVLS